MSEVDAHQSQAGAEALGSLKLATWNLKRLSPRAWKRLPPILEQFARVDADIWVLTESHVSVSPGESYSCIPAPPHPARYRVGEERWVSIWSRWPCRELEVRSTPWAVAASVESPLGALIVYGTVLPYRNEPAEGSGPAPVWSRFKEELDAQAEDWEQIRRDHPSIPLIVAGDLNQSLDGSRWYGTSATRELLLKAFQTAELTCVTTEDVVAAGKLQDERHLVDHIAISSELTASNLECWEPKSASSVQMSDHPGVAVGLELRA